LSASRLGPGDEARLASNLKTLRERVAAACRSAGRAAESVTIVAATKYGGPRLAASLLALGQRDLGENRVDHLAELASGLGPDSGARWHFIGHLQRNKVKKIEAPLSLLHSLDSESLAGELASRLPAPVPVLVQVNIAGEDQKSGVSPAELPALLDALAAHQKIRLLGLMTMPPVDDVDAARGCFSALRELRERLGGASRLPELSMGMSDDFEIAIQEGASIIRIGRALYEGLTELDNTQG
jgi:pyridoxal phosphate enzyme (YggS family)